MSDKYRVVVTYRDGSVRAVSDGISLNAALFLQDGFLSVDEGHTQSVAIEIVEGDGNESGTV